MDARLSLALLAGRLASEVSRRLGRGGGTVLPGHVVQRIEPGALPRIAARLPRGVVLISGTNGKTTTTRMVARVASAAGLRPIHNRSGANLMTGIVAALCANTDLAGRPRGDIGVFEADEAEIPNAAASLRPHALALLNVFRDQLDRYGEVELISATWRRAVEALDREATLILNADDPIVAQLAEGARCNVIYFGIEDEAAGSAQVPHEADKRLCHRCGARIRYTWAYYGHMGHYYCGDCGWSRPSPHVALYDLSVEPGGRMRATLAADDHRAAITLPLTGLYNAYNALAAATICLTIGLPERHVVAGLEGFTAVFGRQETIPVGEGAITLTLVKNPVGFNQVLQTLPSPKSQVPSPKSGEAGEPGTWDLGPGTLVVIAINDLFADGTDVSWLWDVDFEALAGSSLRFLCSGLRADDMALRLKYAGIDADRIEVEPRLERAVDAAVHAAGNGAHVALCPTYTAMLTMRAELQRRGCVAPFWED